jgi:cytidylate kinase
LARRSPWSHACQACAPRWSLKLYLDASVDERIRRRHEELAALGRNETPEQVREELALRDTIDSGRDVSPLQQAADAVRIDTDGHSLDEVVARIRAIPRSWPSRR